MANATRVDASSVAQKLKGAVEADTVTQRPGVSKAPLVKKSAVNLDAQDYPKHLSDSSGFLLGRLAAHLKGAHGVNADNELDACAVFKKSLEDSRYLPDSASVGSYFVPLCIDFLPESVALLPGVRYMKSMWQGAMDRFDPEEAEWLTNGAGGRIRKSQSYLIDNIGGTLVAPPVQGELIELMRPKQVMMSAGCTSVPLPPNGKVVYPRQTSPSTGYWVGENTSITESQVGTGQIALQAKKLAVYLTVPNELLKYASVAADALIRKDTATTLGLGFDYATLYGAGGDFQPRGLDKYTAANQLIDYAGLTPQPKGVAANGNTLRPEDGYRMIGQIENRNFDFKGWITLPSLANNISGYRADAVTPGDAAGQFVQALTRAMGDKMPGTSYDGYPMNKSNIVKSNLTKGTGTGLTDLWGGAWEHLLLGMYGAVEFTTSNQAGNTFQNDQTALRSIMFCDSVPRYEAPFIRYTSLINATN